MLELKTCVRFLFIFAMLLLMISIDQFGERIFVNYVFAAFGPSNPDFHPIDPSTHHKSSPYPNLELFEQSTTGAKDFPDDFKFGVSTSAYQVEGGWNADGKSPSTWDTFVHDHPELIADGSNVDVGSDSYHLFEKDVDAVNHVGVNIVDNR